MLFYPHADLWIQQSRGGKRRRRRRGRGKQTSKEPPPKKEAVMKILLEVVGEVAVGIGAGGR